MLAILNILYLLLPISQTGSEAGVNIIAGPNLEYTKLESIENQAYFYGEEDFQMGFHLGLGGYYNYYFDRDYYIGLKTAYKHQNTTFLEYEPEVINIDGQAVDGEFEHYFDYTLESINLALNGGYRLNQRFALELGLLYALPITSYQIHSKETIVKPTDAGVFKEEGTRIRNEQKYSVASSSSKLGAFIGLNGLFPMNKSETVFLKPSLSYSYLFTENLDNLTSWKTDFIDLSVGVSFILGGNEIFGDKNKVIEPEFTIALFELMGTVERSLRTVQIGYAVALDIKSTKTNEVVLKSRRNLIAYVGVKNKLDRNISFKVLANQKQAYKIETLEESNRLEIDIDNLIKNTSDKEISFIVESEDEYDKQLELPVEFNKSGEFGYILTNNSDEIIDYLNNNPSNKYELYTEDKSIYKSLSESSASNITILPKGNFTYHFDQLEGMQYLLVVE
jgi:hypothetical protein